MSILLQVDLRELNRGLFNASMIDKDRMARLTGMRIRSRRMALGLTQKQLGARLNITYATVSRWEAGHGERSLEDIERLVVALEVDQSYFLGAEHVARTAEKTAGDRQLLEKFHGLSNEAKDFVLTTIDALAARQGKHFSGDRSPIG